VTSAMRSACSVLRLKENAVWVEVHYQEGTTSTYPRKPLAVINIGDLMMTRHQLS
jgi:hypothetical protein